MTALPVTRSQIVARLAENSIPFVEMPLRQGISVIVSERGGRVYGPFVEDGESILWAPSVFRDAASFSWLAGDPGGWNLGGDRIWIGPEIQYLVRDLRDPVNSCVIPPQMDPGNWRLVDCTPSNCLLAWSADLEARHMATGVASLRLERRITPAPDPLRQVSAYPRITASVAYGGYEQTLKLETQGNAVQSAIWSVTQVRAGGAVHIPCLPEIEATTYFGSPPGGSPQPGSSCVKLAITARKMFKTGYKSAYVIGRVGYLNQLGDGRYYLLIRSFPNQPSSDYREAPSQDLSRRGDSIFVYNDDGGIGEFGEIECMGQAIGSNGRTSSTDTLTLWCYVGPLPDLQVIGRHLLGIEVGL